MSGMEARRKAFEEAPFSEKARMALEDWDACGKDPRYRRDMNYYFVSPSKANAKIYGEPEMEDKCSVCLAGSVFAKTYEWPLDGTTENYNIPRWALALDALQRGSIVGALVVHGCRREWGGEKFLSSSPISHEDARRIEGKIEDELFKGKSERWIFTAFDFDNHPVIWRRSMETAIKIIRKAGL